MYIYIVYIYIYIYIVYINMYCSKSTRKYLKRSNNEKEKLY